ncbi:hypothetical protein [Nocardioides marmotae]|uniref:Uncharacterized protein n=1 Tax=Nocardioides marmotae TaxID=2663857 RepID=A0A6I3JGE5_9ACTN|nr:hypothetical protein [Nocardioides marmotae]MCR6033482.1 hypothetical protein [Gordonia jinghuaiqii]MBC9735010.1 hypothetical protein [Nocardioides marmotae]MTB86109.1 hypothetical protein [Nocardioides marmotae]MTB97140.1 hypothetical protein [Nocardioides marmotae]QKE00791.1 hypothetical protein HPC71_06660 [Nocardioides marmotae]
MALRATLPLLPALVHRVREWPEASQLQARRNAMVASTALARRRAEQVEVEEFLAVLAGTTRTTPTTAPAVATRRAAHG